MYSTLRNLIFETESSELNMKLNEIDFKLLRMCTNGSDWIPISAKFWNTLEHVHLAFSPKKPGFATRRSAPARRKPVARTFGISCKEILGPFYIFCSGSLFFRELFVELLTQLF